MKNEDIKCEFVCVCVKVEEKIVNERSIQLCVYVCVYERSDFAVIKFSN